MKHSHARLRSPLLSPNSLHNGSEEYRESVYLYQRVMFNSGPLFFHVKLVEKGLSLVSTQCINFYAHGETVLARSRACAFFSRLARLEMETVCGKRRLDYRISRISD